jgi:hypothetical protein
VPARPSPDESSVGAHVDEPRTDSARCVAAGGPICDRRPGVELSAADEHRSFSRSQATVTCGEDAYRIAEEPRVANGTFVNGAKLTAGTAVLIRDGDEVLSGPIRTTFRTT